MTIQDINFTTTKIEIVETGNVIASATGFFFRHNEVKYLATNRHVVIDEEKKYFPDSIRITLHANRVDLTKNRNVDLSLYKDTTPLWLQHPNYKENMCDIALIPLNKSTLQGNNYDIFMSSSITFIGSEIINTRDIHSFGSVVIVGYPLGFHDEKHNLPVYRRATIASCYGINFNGLPYFLVDANLHQGTSGSPVVNTHHTLFKESDGQEGYAFFGVHSAEHVVGQDPLGLNVVWYASLIEEIASQ